MTASSERVSLREITPRNRKRIEKLKVTHKQAKYVDSVAESLVEAAETPQAQPWYRAAFVDDLPGGFVMLSESEADDPDRPSPYYVWRFLIDRRHQGQGYGAAALGLVVDHVRSQPDARVLTTSVVPGPSSPLGFYLRHGFRLTGQVYDGELVLELDLSTSSP